MQQAQQADFGPFDASEWRLGIVVAQFNHHITEELYQSAVQRAVDYKIGPDAITAAKVAGSVEIPLILQKMATSGRFQALLAIGCVIKGDTPHFEYVCRLITDGVLRVQLDYSIPVGFGILTCLTEDQAMARAHLGGEYLDAILHQAKTLADV